MTEHHASSPTAAPARLHLHGRLTRADRERDLYAYLPFDVPAGIAAIRISLDHDPPGDAEDPTRGAVIRHDEELIAVTNPIFLEAS